MDLTERIRQGMTTARDAFEVSNMIERLSAYEVVLRKVAVKGPEELAWAATCVLVHPEWAKQLVGGDEAE